MIKKEIGDYESGIIEYRVKKFDREPIPARFKLWDVVLNPGVQGSAETDDDRDVPEEEGPGMAGRNR